MNQTPQVLRADALFLFLQVAMLATSSLTPSCAIISYRHDGPTAARAGARPETLYYRVKPLEGVSMGSGLDALKHSMRENEVFAKTELVDGPTALGISVDVQTLWVPPSIGALVYGYVDLALLFLLPLYSDSMGYDVQYKVQVNGQKIRIYEYPIRRTVFAWLPVLPVVWANLLTESEADAFAEVTHRFFQDATRDGAFDSRAPLPSPSASVGTPSATLAHSR